MPSCPLLAGEQAAMRFTPATFAGMADMSAEDADRQRATGTDDTTLSAAPSKTLVAPMVALTRGKKGVKPSIRDHEEETKREGQETQKTPEKQGFFEAEGTGVEPATGFPAPHFQCGR